MKRPPGPMEGLAIVLAGVAAVAIAIMVISAAVFAFGGPDVVLRWFVGAGVTVALVGLAANTVR